MKKNKQENGCRELTLRQTAKYLHKHDNYIILTHASPDGDTLGSAYALYYALKEIGKAACVICPDVIPEKYNYFARQTDHVSRDDATVVAVDVADKRLLGGLEEEFGDMFSSGADSASYKLMAGDVLEVGENVDGGIVPGYYIASCSNGFVSFMIMGEEGENGSMTVTDGVERKITLKEGDLIGIINTESEDSALMLTAR